MQVTPAAIAVLYRPCEQSYDWRKGRIQGRPSSGHNTRCHWCWMADHAVACREVFGATYDYLDRINAIIAANK